MCKTLLFFLVFVVSVNVSGQRLPACRDRDEIHVRWLELYYLMNPFDDVSPFLSKDKINLYTPEEDDPYGRSWVKLGFDFTFIGDSVKAQKRRKSLNDDLFKIIKGRLYPEDLYSLKKVIVNFRDDLGKVVRFKNVVRSRDTLPNLEDSFYLPLRIMPFQSTFTDRGDTVLFAFWPYKGEQNKFDPEYFLNQAGIMIKNTAMRKRPRAMRLYYFDDSTQLVVETSKNWSGWQIPARSLKPEHFRPVFWDIPYLGKID